MESAEQPTKDLQEKVKGFLNQAGHPVTANDVNPSKDSHLENVTDFLGKATGHIAGSVSGEEGPLIHVETAPGSKVVSIMKSLLHLKKAA